MKLKLKDFIQKYGYEHGYELFKSENKVSERLSKYILKYGFINGIDKYIRVCNASTQSLENFIRLYGNTEGVQRYNKWKNNSRPSLEKYIKKYGKDKGIVKFNQWQENIKKNRITTIEQYIDKYGKELGTQKYNDWKKSLDHSSLSFFIKKYGNEIGYQKYNDYVKRQSFSCKKLLKSDKMKYINSLQFYVDRYGKELGTQKYNDWKKSQDHGSLSFFIKKYGEKEGYKKYISTNISKARIDQTYFSKISQELFKIIAGKIKDHSSVKFASNGGELTLFDKEIERRYFYDFCYCNKIIEYNGDYWHANPRIYNESDILTKGKTAKEIWDYDTRKIEFAKNNGYEILIIWDSEYKYDKLKVIDRCIQFLNQ